MAKNKGKSFEQVVRECFMKVPGVSIDRIPDQTMHHKGATNICDFIVYKEPYEYYIECKSVHGKSLRISSIPKEDKHGQLHGFYGNISDDQWNGLLEKSKIPGVYAGVLCWWVDKDTTMFIDIRLLEELRRKGYKSIDYCASFALEDIDNLSDMWTWVIGKKKRVYFDYDMEGLLNEISNPGR